MVYLESPWSSIEESERNSMSYEVKPNYMHPVQDGYTLTDAQQSNAVSVMATIPLSQDLAVCFSAHRMLDVKK